MVFWTSILLKKKKIEGTRRELNGFIEEGRLIGSGMGPRAQFVALEGNCRRSARITGGRLVECRRLRKEISGEAGKMWGPAYGVYSPVIWGFKGCPWL